MHTREKLSNTGPGSQVGSEREVISVLNLGVLATSECACQSRATTEHHVVLATYDERWNRNSGGFLL